MKIFVVSLKYKINFHDADEGDCYAGDGNKLIKVFYSNNDAKKLIEEWNPIIKLAELETIIFPVQKHNKQLEDFFGFVLDNFDNGYGFELICEEFDLE
jgi:hypothetical protein